MGRKKKVVETVVEEIIKDDVAESHQRFKDVDWFKPKTEVQVLGVGGIGSWLSLFLARQGCTLYISDLDKVDRTNLGGQFYSENQYDLPKVQATIDNVNNFAKTEISSIGKFTESSPINNIVFTCFDNMKYRKLAFEKWKALDRTKKEFFCFVDGRMLAESMEVYIVLPGREAQYESTLFEDNEVEDQPCSYKATSHCGAMTAAFMTAKFNNAMANFITGEDMRDTRFKFRIDLPQMEIQI